MKYNISLIVPSLSDNFYINDFLINIYLWTLVPSEIIIINTSNKKYRINKTIKKILIKKKIKLLIINKKGIFPGAARNVGILKSKCNYLVFLDMNTLPYKKNWLESNLKYILRHKLDGLIGQTYYLANTHKEKIIRASTYGSYPLNTVPGSIFKRHVVEKNGLFNSTIRAGEDTEWIIRLKKYNFNVKKCLYPVCYKGLYNVSYLSMIKKWYRNYSQSGNLPHLSTQKNFYFFLLFIVCFFLVFNWNIYTFNKVSSNQYWVPHITKFFLSSTILLYLLIRGFFYPIKKKISFKFLIPYNFLFVTINSFVLDAAKLLAFLRVTFSKSIKQKK